MATHRSSDIPEFIHEGPVSVFAVDIIESVLSLAPRGVAEENLETVLIGGSGIVRSMAAQ